MTSASASETASAENYAAMLITLNYIGPVCLYVEQASLNWQCDAAARPAC